MKLTAQAMAELLGVSRATVHRWLGTGELDGLTVADYGTYMYRKGRVETAKAIADFSNSLMEDRPRVKKPTDNKVSASKSVASSENMRQSSEPVKATAIYEDEYGEQYMGFWRGENFCTVVDGEKRIAIRVPVGIDGKWRTDWHAVQGDWEIEIEF